MFNFYPCHFEIEDIRFSSVEEYLCYKKALLFDSRDVVANDIERTNEPNDLAILILISGRQKLAVYS